MTQLSGECLCRRGSCRARAYVACSIGDFRRPIAGGAAATHERPGDNERALAYGIRTENLVLVVESPVGDGKFLEFETLTLTPIDQRLINGKLLSKAERNWLNAYHKRVWKEIGPALKGEAKAPITTGATVTLVLKNAGGKSGQVKF